VSTLFSYFIYTGFWGFGEQYVTVLQFFVQLRIAKPSFMSQAILFEDIFDVKKINPDGKKFEKGFFKKLKKTHFIS